MVQPILPDDDPGARHHFLTERPADSVRPPLPVVSGATFSLTAHAIALVIVTVALANKPASISPDPGARTFTRLVYSAKPGGGGDPGGGLRTPSPVRRVEVARPASPATIAIPSAPAPTLNPRDIQDPPQRIAIPEPAVLAGLREAIGAITELRPPDDSRGPGTGAGAGTSTGSGISDGSGGLYGGGTGPGANDDGVQPGNGVSWPRLVREVKPNYTADAMRAQVEGMVELEIVVLADGTVGRVRIVRSLDGRFGLDQEAIDAVRRWRFEPGRHLGKAVPVRVGVELSFNLR